ncbi:MAG: UDP-N-acetylmuramoyl-L-alanine--D-glutamate ligase [Alphaproteobacteria bacterium]
MLWQDLAHKTIGIWGMGLEGTAARRAVENHVPTARLIEISEENLTDLRHCQIVIKSPGISLYRPEIHKAKHNGVLFTSGTNLFFANKNPLQKVLAVTGTKGKSTTSALLAHTLNILGHKTTLGGNIGKPLLETLNTPAEYIVAELSSYQCADFTGTPDMAVLLNLYPEHLPWHTSHERYWADKLNMVSRARTIILNAADHRTQQLARFPNALYFNRDIHVQNDYFYDREEPLFPVQSLHLNGLHNAQNACAVLTAVKSLGLPLKACEEAFQTFSPLPHRLQIIATVQGVTFVDDSISTTPETAMAALEAFARPACITLIVGGQDRGQDFTDFISYVAAHPNVQLITLPDTGKRVATLARARSITTYESTTMASAVQTAKRITPAGGLVLLSPAAPSYNMFKNFEERGYAFQTSVKESQSPLPSINPQNKYMAFLIHLYRKIWNR